MLKFGRRPRLEWQRADTWGQETPGQQRAQARPGYHLVVRKACLGASPQWAPLMFQEVAGPKDRILKASELHPLATGAGGEQEVSLHSPPADQVSTGRAVTGISSSHSSVLVLWRLSGHARQPGSQGRDPWPMGPPEATARSPHGPWPATTTQPVGSTPEMPLNPWARARQLGTQPGGH